MSLLSLPPKRFRLKERRFAPASVTEGSLPHAVWQLAWPTVITQLLFSATGLINVIFVGQLGKNEIAVVGRSEQIFFLLMSMVTAVSVGTSALVARFIGAEEPQQAKTVARQSYIMSVIGGLIATFILLTCSGLILRLMNVEEVNFSNSIWYLHILGIVQVPMYFLIVSGAVYRGVGDTRTPMIIMLLVNALQIFFDWSLIFGWGPLPQLGVLGAAYSGMISRSAGAILTVLLLMRSPFHRTSLTDGDWLPHWDWFRRILAIGIPTAVQQTLRVTGSMVFLGILGALPNGTASVAALTVGLRVESIAFMPGFAYSMAAATMVGQNLGAQQPERAERAAWVCAWQAMSMMAMAGAAFLLFPRAIIHVFTHDAEVVPLGIGYLYANGTAQPLLSLGIALSGALQGAGETKIPAWITFLTMWFIRVPFTFLLAKWMGLGTLAAWVVMAVTNMSYGIIITALFKRGKWKNREV